MKRIAFFSILIIFSFMQVKAQEGFTRLNFSAGVMHKEAYTGTISLEFGKGNHKYVEVFADGYRSGIDQTENYIGGVAYKPNLTRSSNRYLNFRVGAGLGSDTNNLIGGVQAGFEAGVILPRSYVLMLHQKNEFMIGTDHPLRTGLLIGFKIPL